VKIPGLRKKGYRNSVEKQAKNPSILKFLESFHPASDKVPEKKETETERRKSVMKKPPQKLLLRRFLYKLYYRYLISVL